MDGWRRIYAAMLALLVIAGAALVGEMQEGGIPDAEADTSDGGSTTFTTGIQAVNAGFCDGAWTVDFTFSSTRQRLGISSADVTITDGVAFPTVGSPALTARSPLAVDNGDAGIIADSPFDPGDGDDHAFAFYRVPRCRHDFIGQDLVVNAKGWLTGASLEAANATDVPILFANTPVPDTISTDALSQYGWDVFDLDEKLLNEGDPLYEDYTIEYGPGSPNFQDGTIAIARDVGVSQGYGGSFLSVTIVFTSFIQANSPIP